MPITAYHCGPHIERFTLDRVGTGEGNMALGPGVYFATNPHIARRYCKYHDNAELTVVEIDDRGLYESRSGNPEHLKKGLIELARMLAAQKGMTSLPMGNTLKHGPGSVGDIFRAVGPRSGRKLMSTIGITGLLERMPGSNGIEIAVYDLSIIRIVDRIAPGSIEAAAPKYSPLRELQPGEPKTYDLHAYHATSTDNWLPIRRKGLVPGASKPAGQDWMGRWSGKAIYFHQEFPDHELDNAHDGENFWTIVLEYRFSEHADRVVPDEEWGSMHMTPEAIRTKAPIAVGNRIPSTDLVAIHLPDLPSAREWARENARGKKVVFHKDGIHASTDYSRGTGYDSVDGYEYLIKGEKDDGLERARKWGLSDSQYKVQECGDGPQLVLVNGAIDDLDWFTSKHNEELFYRHPDNPDQDWVPLSRHFGKSVEAVWDEHKYHSWAWVSPKGELIEMENREDHRQWAREYLEKNEGKYAGPWEAHQILREEGWTAMTTPFIFNGPGEEPWDLPQAALNTIIETAIEYSIELGADPEDIDQLGGYIQWEGRNGRLESMSLADFVAKYGGRKWEDKLFSGMMERLGAVRVPDLKITKKELTMMGTAFYAWDGDLKIGSLHITHPFGPEDRRFQYLSRGCEVEFQKLRDSMGADLKLCLVISSEVSKAYRGMGVGGKLYREALDWCRKEGAALGPDKCGAGGHTSDDALKVWESLKREFPHVGEIIAEDEGEDEDSGSSTQRNSDPLPSEFRDYMKEKGKAFTSPKSGNKVLFDSLPWEEQLKHYEKWKREHDDGRDHARDEAEDEEAEHDADLANSDKNFETSQERKMEEEKARDKAERGDPKDPSVPPKDKPRQILPNGEPAATGNNLHPDTQVSFTDVANEIGWSDDDKREFQEEIFKKEAKEVDSHASNFRTNRERYGIGMAILMFFMDLGVSAHNKVRDFAKDTLEHIKKDIGQTKDEAGQAVDEANQLKQEVIDHYTTVLKEGPSKAARKMEEKVEGSYDIINHCPHCQGILHDGPRWYLTCPTPECGYCVCFPGFKDIKGIGLPGPCERLPGTFTWTPIPKDDPRLIQHQEKVRQNLDYFKTKFGIEGSTNIKDWVIDHGPEFTLYREVILEDHEDLDISKLGQFWTPDFKKAHSPFARVDSKVGKPWVLKVIVQEDDIDMPGTIAALRRHPGEAEIRLIRGRRLTNIQVLDREGNEVTTIPRGIV